MLYDSNKTIGYDCRCKVKIIGQEGKLPTLESKVFKDTYHKKIGFDQISDKLIAFTFYLSASKSANSRYKFGYYAYKVSDLNDVYDAIMTSYPYHNTYRQETTYESCNSIENLQIAS